MQKFFVLALCLSFSVCLVSQTSQDEEKPTGAPRRGARPLMHDGIPFMVSVIRNDINITRTKTLEMWAPHYVYRETGNYYYLGIPSRTSYHLEMEHRLGWIAKNWVLDSPGALRTPNKIYRRVIVFDNTYEKRVPIFMAPKEDAEERCKTPLFSFFYIYKEEPEHYLIGISPNIDLEYPSDDILGWIQKKSCREWNTRLAVSYKDENREARIKMDIAEKQGLCSIYKTLEEAKDLKRESVVAKESERALWSYNMPRYPLLQSVTHEQKRLFHIAFLGGQRSEIIQQCIAKIKEEKKKLSRLDVMFVIDGSSDTNKIREQIAKSIENLSKQFRSQATKKKGTVQLEIAWGALFYRDFTRGQRYRYQRGRLFEPKVVHIVPFSTDATQFLMNLNNEPFQGEKYEEKSLFYGIDMAMHEKVDWRPGSTRCLIVAGVSGNHERDSKHDITHLTSPEIQLSLQRKRMRVHAVSFVQEKEKVHPLSLSFYKQMSELCKDMKEGGYFPMLESSGDERPLQRLLSALFENYQYEIYAIQAALGDLERGFTPQELNERHGKNWDKIWEKLSQDTAEIGKMMGSDFPLSASVLKPSLASLIEAFIDMHGIKVSDLKGDGGFFEQGWVWEFNPLAGIAQIQVCLLIDQLELSRLVGFLSSLHLELKKASNPEQYTEIWKTLLKTTFGIDTIPPNEPLDNLIIQHTGLPFMNGLLNYTLEDFIKKARIASFRQSILEKIEQTSNRLFLILEEKEVQHISLDDGSTYTRTKRRWWNEEGNELKYSWIEIEIFP